METTNPYIQSLMWENAYKIASDIVRLLPADIEDRKSIENRIADYLMGE